MIKHVGVLVWNKENKKILAVKRSVTDSLWGGMWALPGGIVEDGESFYSTAKREMKEETSADLISLANEP